MKRHEYAWYFWCAGTIIIVLSWFDVVSTKIGWLGFGIALIGSVMSWGLRPPHSNPPNDVYNTENKDL